MTLEPVTVLQWALALLGGAVGVYAAIRADLAALKVRAENAQKAADEARGRLDRHIEIHHGRA